VSAVTVSFFRQATISRLWCDMLSVRPAWDFLLERRRYWLVPMLAMLVTLGSLFVISAGGRFISVVYPMF
jgi:hypothetical protein